MDGAGHLGSLTRRGLFALGGTALFTAVAGCASGPPVPAPQRASVDGRQVRLTFEDGALGTPVSRHIGASVSPEFAQAGNYGCRLEPLPRNGDIAALVINDHAFLPDRPWASVSLSFRLVTLPGSSDTYMNLFEIGNTATTFPKSQFTVYFKHDQIVCDFNSSESAHLAPVPPAGTWHRLDAVVDYGGTQYTARVRFDQGRTVQLVSKNDKTPQSVRALWVHYPNVPVDYTMDLDSLRMLTSGQDPGYV